MLGDVDERLLKVVNDYKINLIEPAAIEDLEKFSSDFKYVLQIIKCSDDKSKLNKIVNENREFFSQVPMETALLIKQCTDIDVYIKEERKGVNMCKAIEDMKADAREEGRQEARKEMSKAIEDMKADAREEGRQEARKEMSKAIEDMKADAREEGRQEGRQEAKIITVINLYLKGLIDEDKSAKELGMDVEQYRERVELLKNM